MNWAELLSTLPGLESALTGYAELGPEGLSFKLETDDYEFRKAAESVRNPGSMVLFVDDNGENSSFVAIRITNDEHQRGLMDEDVKALVLVDLSDDPPRLVVRLK